MPCGREGPRGVGELLWIKILHLCHRALFERLEDARRRYRRRGKRPHDVRELLRVERFAFGDDRRWEGVPHELPGLGAEETRLPIRLSYRRNRARLHLGKHARGLLDDRDKRFRFLSELAPLDGSAFAGDLLYTVPEGAHVDRIETLAVLRVQLHQRRQAHRFLEQTGELRRLHLGRRDAASESEQKAGRMPHWGASAT